jgi:thiamine-phosphate pyrophosphorylase
MKLVVISPEDEHAREHAVLDALFVAGLERYHVRKPAWSRVRLETWLQEVPERWRPRLVLHQHHELVETHGLGGRHWRDDGAAPAISEMKGKLTSRSCHNLAAVRAALGRYDSVFLGPVFPSISKPGYEPSQRFSRTEISSLLANRTTGERHTAVLALGGITPERVGEVHALGFDGVAVLGAIWGAADPVRVFGDFQEARCCHVA